MHADTTTRSALRRLAASGLAAALLTACSMGPMDTSEVYYLKVTNGTDSNYFRVKVDTSTRLSDAKFKSGWFPAEAVDALFGETSQDTTGSTRAARDDMRAKMIEALKEAQQSYLTVALQDGATRAEIDRALEAWKRVRFAPGLRSDNYGNAVLMEYNPARGLEVLRSDEKLVFVLSADPDAIIQGINRIANDQETKAAIQRFTNVLVEQAKADVQAKAANAEVAARADVFIAGQVEALSQSLENKADRDTVVRKMEALHALLRSLEGVGGRP